MDFDEARDEISEIFSGYKTLLPSDHTLLYALNKGKLYELYVLSQLVIELRCRGCVLSFVGTNIKFKSSPGQIKLSDPHFEVVAPSGRRFWMFVDIEFLTLGGLGSSHSDLSDRHELDIVLVGSTSNPYPTYNDIALGVECKCVGKFYKGLVKEALGIRRELSYLGGPFDSVLTLEGAGSIQVNAIPPSEFWLAYVDRLGDRYADSPGAFSIDLRHIEPYP